MFEKVSYRYRPHLRLDLVVLWLLVTQFQWLIDNWLVLLHAYLLDTYVSQLINNTCCIFCKFSALLAFFLWFMTFFGYCGHNINVLLIAYIDNTQD